MGLFLAGCGQEAQSPGPEARTEVRGEPIRGEPITSRAGEVSSGPSTSTVAVAAGGVETKTVEANNLNTQAATASTTAVAAGGAGGTTSAVGPTAVPGGAAKVQAGTGTAASPLIVGFDRLASFSYSLPDGPIDTNLTASATTSTNQIPTTIRALNEQFVSLKGFMLPLKVEKGLVTELLIMRDQSMCCYGTVPKINEWVSVKMVGDGVKPVMDQAVTLFGKFKVGEMYENGYLVGIYALDGERMAGPLDL